MKYINTILIFLFLSGCMPKGLASLDIAGTDKYQAMEAMNQENNKAVAQLNNKFDKLMNIVETNAQGIADFKAKAQIQGQAGVGNQIKTSDTENKQISGGDSRYTQQSNSDKVFLIFGITIIFLVLLLVIAAIIVIKSQNKTKTTEAKVEDYKRSYEDNKEFAEKLRCMLEKINNKEDNRNGKEEKF